MKKLIFTSALIFMSAMLMLSTNAAKASESQHMIHNKTGAKISICTLHERKWQDVAPNEKKEVVVSYEPDTIGTDVIAWKTGDKIYMTSEILNPKETYIYDGPNYLATTYDNFWKIQITKDNAIKANPIDIKAADAIPTAMEEKIKQTTKHSGIVVIKKK